MDLDYPFLDEACWPPSSTMGSDAGGAAAAAAGPPRLATTSAPMPINTSHGFQQHQHPLPYADSHPYQHSLVDSLESSQSLLAMSYGAVAGSYGSFAAAPPGLRPLHSYAADPLAPSLSHSYHSASGEMCFVPVPDARPAPATGSYGFGSLQHHEQQQQRYEYEQQQFGGSYSFGATPSYPDRGGVYSSSWDAPATMLHAGPEECGQYGQFEAPHPFSHQHRSSQPIAVPHAVSECKASPVDGACQPISLLSLTLATAARCCRAGRCGARLQRTRCTRPGGRRHGPTVATPLGQAAPLPAWPRWPRERTIHWDQRCVRRQATDPRIDLLPTPRTVVL